MRNKRNEYPFTKTESAPHAQTWTKLFVFHLKLMPLVKEGIHLFLKIMFNGKKKRRFR